MQARLLLIASQEAYLQLNKLLDRVDTCILILDWAATAAEGLAASARQQYDLYLVERCYLNALIKVISAPIIVLAEDSNSGKTALEAGAVDYLDKSQLSVAALERSLRLTLKLTRTQDKLRQKEVFCDQLLKARVSNLPTHPIRAANKSSLDFECQLEAAQKRLETIQSSASALAEPSPELLAEAIAELASTLEELHERNQELISTRLVVEQERQHDQELFELALDGYLVTDERGNIQEANRAAANLFAVPKQSLAGKPLVLFVVEADRKIFQRLSQCYQFKQELTLQTQQGQPFAAAIAVYAIRARQGKLLGQRWLIRKTQQKQAKTFKQQEALQTIFNRMPIMIALYDAKGQIQLVNRELERVLGWSFSELQNIDLLRECYPDPEYRQQVLDHMLAANSQWQDLKTRVRDGRIVDTSWANVWLSDGTCIGIGQDITKRKQVEEALAGSEERLRLIANALPACIAYIDAQQHCQFANQNYENWFGYKPEDLYGKTLQEILNNGDCALQSYIEAVFAGEEVTYQTQVPDRQGGTRYLEGTLVPDFDDTQVKGYYTLITDISEQQAALRDRKHAAEQLQYRLNLETALAEVSKLATEEVANLDLALKLLGVAVKANRVFLMRFEAEDNQAEIAHEWCDYEWCDCRTQGSLKQLNVDISSLPWWKAQIEDRELVISNPEALPAAARQEKQVLKVLNVNSLLAVPIYTHSGQLWGQVGFMSCGDDNKQWSDEDARLLRVAGEIFYSYYSRIRTQEKLRASEALYTGIFNHSAEVLFLLRVLPNGFAYETVNAAFEQATGKTSAQVVGKTIAEVLPPEAALWCQKYFHACLSTGEPIDLEATINFFAGSRIWKTKLVPIRDAAGKIVKILGSARDVTEEKQAIAEQLRLTCHQRLLASLTLKIRQFWQIEEILQTAVSEIQTTLQAERVAFLRLQKNGFGKVVSEVVVPGFPAMKNEEIFDAYCQEAVLKHYVEGSISACADIYSANYDLCYLQLLEKHRIRANLIVPIVLNNEAGKEIEQSPRQSLANVKRDQVWGLLCIQQCSGPREWSVDEIELLKQLANQLSIAIEQAQLQEQEIRQRQELARSNAQLEQFAYIASHDLQEPLQTIANYAKLLERRYKHQLDDKASRYIHYMVDGAGRMQSQINDLLEYSRIGSEHNFEQTDFHEVLKQAISNLKASIAQHQATVTFTHLPTLVADASQMLQLLQNLIGNAVKYRGPASPVIQVEAQSQGDRWLFSVSDNGIGIDPKYGDRIFQIFQRLHTQDEYPGTGIGLALCRKIVEHHGGRIWVKSALGQGATFFFTLPIRATDSPQQE